MQLRVLHDALQHRREHRLHLDVVGQLFERLAQEVVELLLEEVDVAAAVAHDRGDLAVVQEREEEMLDGDVLVAALERGVEGEFEGLLKLACNHGVRRCRTNAKDEPLHFSTRTRVQLRSNGSVPDPPKGSEMLID